MSTMKGLKRRLDAAVRALKGDYVPLPHEREEINAKKSEEQAAYAPAPAEQKPAEKQKTAQAQKSAPIPVPPPTAKPRTEHNVLINDSKTVMALNPDYCTGCSACKNACPKGAISMESNSEGFKAPVIDEKKCINCSICKNICPAINPVYKNDIKPKCYAAYGDDSIRAKSSSGGLFTMFANQVLAAGGYVCGAAYDDKFVVRHMLVNDEEGMDKLRESKYVQSQMGDVYTQIGKLLEKNAPVLFCGCGCQVAGLYSYLSAKKIDENTLFTIDLMCHGSPSPGLFEKYINEVHGGADNIDKISFRSKDYYGWSTEMNVRYKDGSEYHKIRSRDPYYKAFLPCISVRKSCGICQTAKLPRQGDITLADFWGVRALNKDYDDGKGTSILIVNNKKGERMVENIKEELLLFEQVDIDYILTHGQPFNHSFKTHPAHDAFFDNIRLGMSVDKAYDYAVNRKFDVAIFGVWHGCNYGSIATYYGLHEIIRSFGLSVLMIDKPFISPNDPEHGNTHSRRFANEHYAVSRQYRLNELATLNNHVDTFIMGCDQVWNRGINSHFGFAYYLSFANDNKKLLSYAASFGHQIDFSSVTDRRRIAEYMQRFDNISVREADGVRLCKESYGVEATQVLDPVFVADRSIYDKLTEKSAQASAPDKDEKYLATYILDPSEEKKAAIRWVAKKLGVKIVNVLDGLPWTFKDNFEKMKDMGETRTNVQVEDWLYHIKNCEFLITDSCHGISFGIIFEKPFIGIGNTKRGMSRFRSLLGLFDLLDRFVTDPIEIIDNEKLLEAVDYKRVGEILKTEKERSLNWLKNAIFSPKVVKSMAVYPTIDKRLEDEKNKE